MPIGRHAAIPLREITFRASRSSGPGGQHANVTASRIEAIFDVAASASLTDEQKHRVTARLGPRVVAVAQDERSQTRNRELALERLQRRLTSALASSPPDCHQADESLGAAPARCQAPPLRAQAGPPGARGRRVGGDLLGAPAHAVPADPGIPVLASVPTRSGGHFACSALGLDRRGTFGSRRRNVQRPALPSKHMRWLVDGMNVIGTRPDAWWKDRDAAMLRLVDMLERWAASDGEDVTVVFERPPSPPIRSTVIDVAHAPRPKRNAADEEIVRRSCGPTPIRAPCASSPPIVGSPTRRGPRARASRARTRFARAWRRSESDSLKISVSGSLRLPQSVR